MPAPSAAPRVLLWRTAIAAVCVVCSCHALAARHGQPVVLASGPSGGAAWVASASADKPKKPKQNKAAKEPKAAPGGSGETRAERDRRLQRECKGRPNAGACLGYAS